MMWWLLLIVGLLWVVLACLTVGVRWHDRCRKDDEQYRKRCDGHL